jgi:hypothetical protein
LCRAVTITRNGLSEDTFIATPTTKINLHPARKDEEGEFYISVHGSCYQAVVESFVFIAVEIKTAGYKEAKDED